MSASDHPELPEEGAIPGFARPEAGDEQVLPLHAETVSIDRRTVPVATVRVQTETIEQPYEIAATVRDERIEIERRPIGRIIAADPGIREEGDVTIIPVIAETIVTERRLMLVEEIHLRRVRTTRPYRETVLLKSQKAVITRVPLQNPADTSSQPEQLEGTSHDE